MKVLISGNPNEGLAEELYEFYPDATFASRVTGYDLTQKKGRDRFAEEAKTHDVIIVNAALWQFQQTVLLDAVYKECRKVEKRAHIVCIGSTTDRVKKGGSWLYNAEKKALRDYCNTLSLTGVWSGGPRVSLISFGTLTNNQDKHPDRKCMEVKTAASYINWLIEQPPELHINEISIDPVQ